jgi:hypothetical protein
MKTRPFDWFDESKRVSMYGLQVLTEGGWKNLAEDGKPCIYPTTAERDQKRAEYRRRKAISHTNLRAN